MKSLIKNCLYTLSLLLYPLRFPGEGVGAPSPTETSFTWPCVSVILSLSEAPGFAVLSLAFPE